MHDGVPFWADCVGFASRLHEREQGCTIMAVQVTEEVHLQCVAALLKEPHTLRLCMERGRIHTNMFYNVAITRAGGCVSTGHIIQGDGVVVVYHPFPNVEYPHVHVPNTCGGDMSRGNLKDRKAAANSALKLTSTLPHEVPHRAGGVEPFE